MFLCACLAWPALAQTPSPASPQDPAQASSSKTNDTRQQPNDTESDQSKSQPSRLKRVLRRGAPNCVHVASAGTCWSESEQEKEAKEKQAAEEQQKKEAQQQPPVPKSQPAPRSEDSGPVSSSKETKTDLTPPPGDEVGRAGAAVEDVTEFHPYDPHRAEKDIEIGDFYFKRKNYSAAASRYAEALEWKPRDAEATYKLAQALENLGQLAEARKNYQGYLKILPKGPYAEEAKKAIARLDAKLPPPGQQPAGPISQRAEKPQ